MKTESSIIIAGVCGEADARVELSAHDQSAVPPPFPYVPSVGMISSVKFANSCE